MEGVARARALPVTGEVEIKVLDRKAVRDFAKKSIYENNTPEKILLLGRIESSLGILPPKVDAEAAILDLLEDAVMGIYDPRTKALMIGTHVSEGMLSMVVGHEIAHGLQDMHFGLKSYQTPMDGHNDAETARTFLLEGDAQAAYLSWVSGEAGLASIGDEVLDAVGNQALDLASVAEHPILARVLQLPYADGAATIVRLARERGWSAIDALYKDLPTTSEQMLHLDKLLAREPAIAVTVDAAPLLARLPGHRAVWEDDLGEASLLAMLADVEKSPIARKAAAGWGGDRFVALDRADDVAAGRLPMVVGVIAMDRASDADEFEPAFRAYHAQHMPKAHVLERRGEHLLFATQVADAATQAMIREVGWSAFTVEAPAAKG
ncbi:MAG: hypothetical protein R3B09_32150, partial [Nannocystaceae bacterium]